MDRDTLDRWNQDESDRRIGGSIGTHGIGDFPGALIGCDVCHKDITACDWDERHRAVYDRKSRIINYLESGTFS